MSNGSGVSRGDRNRNARLERLREAVPTRNAIVGIDLAGRKQMLVVTDHDSKVLARPVEPQLLLIRHERRCQSHRRERLGQPEYAAPEPRVVHEDEVTRGLDHRPLAVDAVMLTALGHGPGRR